MFEIITQNLGLVTLVMWAALAAYAAWYSAKVKRYSPMTSNEARQLWTIHKHDSHCGGRKWRRVERSGKTVGFECQCGYKHVQKRPLVGHAPGSLKNAQISAFDRLHTSHKSN